MGWTGCHRPKGMSSKAFFEKEFSSIEILKSHTAKNVFYVAARSKHRPEEVFALVILMRYSRDPYFNFYYKDMDESMEPFYYDCPATILDLLTPTDDKHANRWLERCRQRLQEQAAKPKAKDGDWIQFREEIQFTNGLQRSLLKLHKIQRKTWFTDQDGWLFRIPNWKDREYTILSEDEALCVLQRSKEGVM